MPVRYSEHSSGPDTRRSGQAEVTQPPAEVVTDSSYVGYSTFSLIELRDELIKRGLSRYGNKPELILRLEEDDAA